MPKDTTHYEMENLSRWALKDILLSVKT